MIKLKNSSRINQIINYLILLVYLTNLGICAVRNNVPQKNNQRPTRRTAATASSSSVSSSTVIQKPSKCNYNNVKIKSGDYYRLPDNIEPKKYRLRLRIDNRANKLFGQSVVSLFIHNKTNVIEFNSVNLNIHAVSFETRTLTVDAQIIYNCLEKETSVVWFQKPLHPGSGNLTISFSGNLTWLIENGVVQGEKGFNYIFSDLGPTDARKKFPSWDEPRFKTQFDLYLIVPKNNVALSNMPVMKNRNYSEKLDEIRFQTTPPISTYQLATVFGPKFYSTELKSNSNKKSIKITIHSMNYRSYSNWQTALEMCEKLLNFYEFYFNHSYPLKKLDLLGLEEFVPGSMEKIGILFFNEKELLIANRSLATEEELNKLAKVLAHSIAHQWLGNIVSLKEWKEFWLFESLASFMEHEALDSLFPQWKTWDSFRGNEFRKSLRYDSSSKIRSLDVMIQNPNDLQLIYSSANCFQKGVSLFRMLKSSLGEERFEESIRNFIKKFKNKPGSLKELQTIFNQTVDELSPRKVEKNFYSKVLTTIFTWTKVSGYPAIEIHEKQTGDDRILFLKQDRFMNVYKNSSESAQIWSIPIGFVNKFNPFSVTSKAIFEQKKIKIVLKNILEDEWVKLNPHAANYYRVKYSLEMLKKFELSIEEKLLSPMDRLNILDDLFAFIERGDYPTELGLKMLTHYVNEDNPNVWETIQSSLDDIYILISNINDPKLKKKFFNYGNKIIAKNFDKLGWSTNTSELSVGYKMRIDDFATQKVREKVLCLAGLFESKKFLIQAQQKYLDYINGKSDLTIDALECVFQNVGSFTNRTSLNRLFEFYRDYDLAEARQLFSLAIGSIVEKKDMKILMSFLMDRFVKPENVHIILQTMSHRSLDLRREIKNQIVNRFNEFTKKFQNPNTFYNFLKSIIETFTTKNDVESLKVLLSKDSHLKPFERSLQFTFDRVEILQNWVKRDRKKIEDFLTSFDDKFHMITTTNKPPSSSIDSNSIENSFFEFDDEFEKKK